MCSVRLCHLVERSRGSHMFYVSGGFVFVGRRVGRKDAVVLPAVPQGLVLQWRRSRKAVRRGQQVLGQPRA